MGNVDFDYVSRYHWSDGGGSAPRATRRRRRRSRACRMTGARGIGSGFGPVSIDVFSLGGGEVVEKGGDDGLGDVFVDGDALLAELERTVLDDAEVCVVERATEAQWRKKSERSVSFSKWCLVTVKMSTQQISMRERLTFMTIGARCLVCSARSFFVFPGSTRETVYSGGGPNRLCVKSNPSPLPNRPRSDEHDASGAFDARLLLLVRSVVDVTRAALLKRRLNLRARAHEMHAKRTGRYVRAVPFVLWNVLESRRRRTPTPGASVNRNKNPSSLCQSFIICPPLSMFFTDRAAVTANGGASTSNFLSHFAVRSAPHFVRVSGRAIRTASSIVSIFLGEKSSP